MKKFIFMFFLLFAGLGFSNTVLDSLTGPRWICNDIVANKQLIYLVISKEATDKYNSMLLITLQKTGLMKLKLDHLTLL